ncbi:hypothetical protein F5Y16DRAFT_398734 [Xylariaceae sp. FL0255]|nr:hypothetical protein F5Y16DRAFT_398734 [Xylariaceae sp. FL0255]
MRTLPLSQLLSEVRREIAFPTDEARPRFVYNLVLPYETGNTEEPLDAIQGQIFNVLRDADSLWQSLTLIRVMEVLQSGISCYSVPPPWTSARRTYVVVLVVFALEIVLSWLPYSNKRRKSIPDWYYELVSSTTEKFYPLEFPSHYRPVNLARYQRFRPSEATAMITKQMIATVLRQLLSFFALSVKTTPDELLYLEVRVGLVLAEMLSAEEYFSLSQPFFRDRVGLNVMYPADMKRAVKLTMYTLCRLFEPDNDNAGAPLTSRYISNSFGRDIGSQLLATPKPSDRPTRAALRILIDACIRCGKAMLSGEALRTPTSESHRPLVGKRLLSILNELKGIWVFVKNKAVEFETQFDMFESQEQLCGLQGLYAHAYFSCACYREAIEVLMVAFKAKEVLFHFHSEYAKSHGVANHVSRDHIADASVRNDLLSSSPFASSLAGLSREEREHRLHLKLPKPEEIDRLLPLWVDCLSRLGLIGSEEQHSLNMESASIQSTQPDETIVLIYYLASASLRKRHGETPVPSNTRDQ